MNKKFQEVIQYSTRSGAIKAQETIQNLWSGYGKIVRYKIIGGNVDSVIVKHIQYPEAKKHPRGWNTNLSHERKLKSYQVETHFYQQYAGKHTSDCYLPNCFATNYHENELLLVLEDLDASGFSARKASVSLKDMELCLQWLANFHAIFMHVSLEGLWDVGTYWHLDTRPDELKVLEDISLKKAAKAIDEKLNKASFKTLVHGDAKLANFCFSQDGKKVAAVDFQYVGGGCGMKDVVYFIGSCLYEDDCERYETQMLDFYFSALKSALEKKKSNIDFTALEKEWRELYPVAWTDFHRFIKGWSPGHWKIHSYSERLAREVISSL